MFDMGFLSAACPSSQASRRPAFLVAALALGAVVLLVTGVAWSGASPAYAAEATVNLRTAEPYAVLAGTSVTNTGPSVISGDLGVSPGSAVSGFPPGIVIDGTQHISDAVALQAQNDLTTAYNDAAGRPTNLDVTGQDLGGMTLTSGVYEHTSGMHLTGTLTLDAQGDPDAVFIFKAGSDLIVAPNSTVALINGASPCNVFWKVGSSATLDTNTTFVGTVMALTSATLNTGTDVEGRILARNGTVSLDTNDITAPDCGAVPPSTTGTPTATPTGSGTGLPSSSPTSSSPTSSSPTSSSPTESGSPTAPGGRDDTPGGTPSTPTVPVGHPETGAGPNGSDGTAPLLLFALAAVACAGAVVALVRVTRPPHQR